MLRTVREKMGLKAVEALLFKTRRREPAQHSAECTEPGSLRNLINLAKVIIQECRFALDKTNPGTQGFSRLRGHTLAYLYIGSAFILKNGSAVEIEELGLSPEDLAEWAKEVSEILGFYSPESEYDRNLLKITGDPSTNL